MSDRDLVKAADIEAFMRQNRLPASNKETFIEHYVPLAAWVRNNAGNTRQFFLGISGGQGTGKSTLASFLKCVLEQETGLRVAVLSLDDFYLTRREREALSKQVHPLLKTRGVPGTHDTQLLSACLQGLRQLQAGEDYSLPRFDKSRDDRTEVGVWPTVMGPIDIIILEGWCVGSVAQSIEELTVPVNALEREQDADGIWRAYVNRKLELDYAPVFQALDACVFLQLPDFNAVYRWRHKQETELVESSGPQSTQVMDKAALHHFVQHFERLSKAAMVALPEVADVCLMLDSNHRCVQSIYTVR